ncbi:MAG: protein-glutamine gamma-glutamyltransferase [Tuberibacillus sp.]
MITILIINNQVANVGLAKQVIGPGEHLTPIIEAMVESHEVFNYPNPSLLHFEVQLRAAIVYAAQKLSDSNVRFATFYGSRCNRGYWELTREGGFLLKRSVSPSEAVRDIFSNSDMYAFECATAMVIVLLKAVHSVFGNELFNTLYRHLYLWDWREQDHLPFVMEPVDGYGVPGDILYFKNPEVNPRTSWWQGENAITLPNGRFYGHGVGIQNAEGIISILNKYRRPGATRSAYLMERATRLDVTHLYLLTHPDLSGWTRPYQRRLNQKRAAHWERSDRDL